MNYNIIVDMGGVLMQHNMPGCIAAFEQLMGKAEMQAVLGLGGNGEGAAKSLMEDFECGRVTEEDFVETIRKASKPGTTAEQIVAAWNMMHGGIPQERLEQLREWHDKGCHLVLLSNSNTIHKRDVETNYDMSMFDRCIYSQEVGAHKPERAIYEAVMEYLKIQGWDKLPTLFIDDIAINREVGEEFGWKGFESVKALAGDEEIGLNG